MIDPEDADKIDNSQNPEDEVESEAGELKKKERKAGKRSPILIEDCEQVSGIRTIGRKRSKKLQAKNSAKKDKTLGKKEEMMSVKTSAKHRVQYPWETLNSQTTGNQDKN